MTYIEEQAPRIVRVSDRLWELAEMPLHEVESARLLVEELEADGFELETGVGGLPTAFVATWGSGQPVIGLLAEYDALADLSQEAVPERRPRIAGAGGHGCQHNLFGAAVFGAAIALKRELEQRGIEGTIKVFGCPAEENLSGKAFMAREGVFEGLDACLTWHPAAVNSVWTGSSLANNAANITFFGTTAHAAADPQNGRSALDAVQLMNLGVEFLREHVTAGSRVHYAITDGGSQPNVVPALAKVWYLVRAPRRAEVDELWERVLKCARGAAEMTETRFEVEILKAIWELLPNTTLEGVLQGAMERVGPPAFDGEAVAFGEKIRATVPKAQREAFLRKVKMPEDSWDDTMCQLILPLSQESDLMMGSTDVADVSWCCPTAQFGMACQAMGTPGHSWQSVAQGGMGIGHAGALAAARVLAEAGLELLTDPALIQGAQEEFGRRTGGVGYRCAMPDDVMPAFDQFASSK